LEHLQVLWQDNNGHLKEDLSLLLIGLKEIAKEAKAEENNINY